MRLRAHLLWSVNPLLLWEIVAGGHIDGMAAVFGLLGVAALRARSRPWPARPRRSASGSAAVSGLLIGVATGVKVEYVLIGAAVAWACRRSLRAFAAAAAGFLVVVVPTYLAAGTPAIKVLITRGPGVTWDNMYQLLWRPIFRIHPVQRVDGSLPISNRSRTCCSLPSRWCLLLRFPDRVPGLPAVGPALALSLAWLFVTAFQRPWYDVMAISLLALVLDVQAGLGDPDPLAGRRHGLRAGDPEPGGAALALPNVVQFDGSWLTPAVRFSRGRCSRLALRFRPLGVAVQVGRVLRTAAGIAASDLAELLHNHALWITLNAIDQGALYRWQANAHFCGFRCGQRCAQFGGLRTGMPGYLGSGGSPSGSAVRYRRGQR